MTSMHPRFPTRLRFLERPAGEERRADRSINRFPGLDPFADPPLFVNATTQANSRLYGGGHLPSYSTIVSAMFHHNQRSGERFLEPRVERWRRLPLGGALESGRDTSR